MNKFRNFFATRTVLFYIFLFFLFPTVAKADGFWDGDGNEEGEVLGNPADIGGAQTLDNRSEDNCSFYSSGIFAKLDKRYKEFGNADTDSIGGYAPLIKVDDSQLDGGDRANKSYGSEDVLENEG